MRILAVAAAATNLQLTCHQKGVEVSGWWQVGRFGVAG
jgi:hypothetical protein